MSHCTYRGSRHVCPAPQGPRLIARRREPLVRCRDQLRIECRLEWGGGSSTRCERPLAIDRGPVRQCGERFFWRRIHNLRCSHSCEWRYSFGAYSWIAKTKASNATTAESASTRTESLTREKRFRRWSKTKKGPKHAGVPSPAAEFLNEPLVLGDVFLVDSEPV